ncbi:MAG: metal-sensing transcriptional repressor [Thermomonas hydrothermalis]|nr:metal-sensing transcriptional repressor [Thermomonas hydrothermalis]MCL6619788.1 metal-sensing transcriptional repressor [Thermomonas hydrothermalis]
MAHVTRNQKKLLSRVRRIGGQVAALEKALQANTECGEVLSRP